MCYKYIVRPLLSSKETKQLMLIYMCLFDRWGSTWLLNIQGHITTVATCSSGTVTRNAMPQTQDMTRGTSHWNTQLPILMSRVRPDQEILPRPSTHTRNAQLYDAGMVVVSRQLGRKWTGDLWCANPLR